MPDSGVVFKLEFLLMRIILVLGWVRSLETWVLASDTASSTLCRLTSKGRSGGC